MVSQGQQDDILRKIFDHIGATNKRACVLLGLEQVERCAVSHLC